MPLSLEALIRQSRLLVAEARSLRRQAETERLRAAMLRLDLGTQIAINRERRAGLLHNRAEPEQESARNVPSEQTRT